MRRHDLLTIRQNAAEAIDVAMALHAKCKELDDIFAVIYQHLEKCEPGSPVEKSLCDLLKDRPSRARMQDTAFNAEVLRDRCIEALNELDRPKVRKHTFRENVARAMRERRFAKEGVLA